MLFNIKRLAFVLPFVFLLFAWNFAFADVMETIDGRLHFQTGSNDLFLPGSTSDPELYEIIEIPFWMKFINGPVPPGTITYIEVNFAYNDANWEYVGFEKTDDWPGDLECVDCGDGHITLEFTGQGAPPSLALKKYANIKFRARCIPGGWWWEYFQFDGIADNFANVTEIIEGIPYTTKFRAEPRYNGFLMPTYFKHIYTAADVEAGIGEEVIVPVTAETNFRIFSFNHFIEFDPTKLEFVDGWFNNSIFADPCGACSFVEGPDGVVEVYLVNQNQDYPYSWVNELPEGTEVYYLKFKIIATEDNQTIPVNFAGAGNIDSAWTEWRLADDPCEIFDATNNPPPANNGSITIPEYTAEYYVELDGGAISKTGGIQAISYTMSMQNTFPAGDWTSGPDDGDIHSVFQLPSSYTTRPVAEITDSLDFGTDTYQNGSPIQYMFQNYNSQLPGNFWPPRENLEPMVTLNYYFDESLFEIDYDNRTLDFDIIDEYVDATHDWHTFVEDTTGTIAANSSNGKLTWTVVPTKVNMGEFKVPYASSSGSIIYQNLYIRSNFDIGPFSVKVHVNNNFKISTLTPYNGASSEKLDNSTWRVYFDGSYFHDATEDAQLQIGRLKIYIYCPSSAKVGESGPVDPGQPGPGGDPYPVTAHVSFSEAYIHDDSDYDHFVDLEENNVRGICYPYVEPEEEILEKGSPGSLPSEFTLYPNRPNPFNPATGIAYDVPVATHVRIEVFNVLGQRVTTLVDEYKAPGRYETVWNGTDESGSRVSSGIYLYSMQADKFTQTKKMLLMK
ncbi:MAG: T9SS type A sorting domain-containing protein [Candidatus Zixiibacteriota bacterium]|nr:MAG: T9SS type A sorting domain-containing protein [candidate division Zixibacteria bacterium]